MFNVNDRVSTNDNPKMVKGLHNLCGFISEIREYENEETLYVISFYTHICDVPQKLYKVFGRPMMSCLVTRDCLMY